MKEIRATNAHLVLASGERVPVGDLVIRVQDDDADPDVLLKLGSFVVTESPLAVGDVLHGFCGGIFGRDHYTCSVVEAVGPDWVVVRAPSELDTGLDFAAGRSTLASLRQYRKRIVDFDGRQCCPETKESE